MEIPAVILLIAYAVIVFVVCLFSFFNIYHVLRFGMHTLASYAMSIVYVLVVGAILLTTWIAVRTVDWNTAFTINIPAIGINPGDS